MVSVMSTAFYTAALPLPESAYLLTTIVSLGLVNFAANFFMFLSTVLLGDLLPTAQQRGFRHNTFVNRRDWRWHLPSCTPPLV